MNILLLIAGLIAGSGGIYMFYRMDGGKRLKKIQAKNDKEIAKLEKHLKDLEHKSIIADTKLKEKIIDAKNRALDIVNEAKKEEVDRRKQLEKIEHRLNSKEDQLEKKISDSEKMKDDLARRIEKLKVEEDKLEALYLKQDEALKKITKLTTEEAQQMLLNNVERDYKDKLVEYYNKMEAGIKEDSDKKAHNIIVQAIQKISSDVTSQSTQTLVQLPSDDIKGRVIGREGRNINAFEHLTGVDVIVDDTPGAIVISGFDLVRRYVAKRSLQKLIEDGRIHPARIESVVEETKNEVNKMMVEFGEKAVHEMGIVGLHPDLIKIIGRLRFRTSYGQNVLKHSMEVGYIAAAMAADIGLDVQTCTLIGRDILKKYGLSKDVIHAVAAHHEDVPMETPEARIVQAADAVSSSRPGARRETLDTYLKRLQELEEIAKGFDGIDKAYAIQAGREVRVMVKPDKVDDMGARKLSHEIARKIEEELAYPGVIKVSVLRETRATDVAR